MPPKRTSLADRTAHDITGPPTTPAAPAAAPATSALWSEELGRREVVDLDVQQIMPNRRQPRTIFEQEPLAELAASIREHGVIQPIIVRPIPLTKWEGHARRYELIAGERRWRASILAERPAIPALIREDATDLHTLIELALIENLQRADLHPLEEGRAFSVMRDELGYSYRRIAERVGRSKGYVENRLNLLDLGDDLQQLVRARPDTLMHVAEIARLPDPEPRAALIAAVRDDALSYAETRSRVRALLAPPEVSLYKDGHDRHPDGDHAPVIAGEPQTLPPQASTEHDRRPTGDDVPAANDSTVIPLNARERAMLEGLGSKLEHWLENPARLAPTDWEALVPIAQRLSVLLRHFQE